MLLPMLWKSYGSLRGHFRTARGLDVRNSGLSLVDWLLQMGKLLLNLLVLLIRVCCRLLSLRSDCQALVDCPGELVLGLLAKCLMISIGTIQALESRTTSEGSPMLCLLCVNSFCRNSL